MTGKEGRRLTAPALPAQGKYAAGKGLTAWLAIRRAEAAVRGGKPWSKSQLASMGEEYRKSRQQGDGLYVADRKPGEIANPITGEIITDCLTIGRLAELLAVTTDKLTDMLVGIGAVQRVLDHREVPMVCMPAVRKPRYFLTPEATRSGIEDGLVIPVAVYRDGALRGVILITPWGQERLRPIAGIESETPRRGPEERRIVIEKLMRAGHSQAEIVRLTQLPRQTVSRHVRALCGGG